MEALRKVTSGWGLKNESEELYSQCRRQPVSLNCVRFVEMPSDKKKHKRSKSKKHKHKKHSKYGSSPSSTSSAGSSAPRSPNLMRTLEERRIKEHLERKSLKEKLKAQETVEEKRARRLLEKQAKEARRRERMGWDTEYQHYTNQDNPFGDSNLTSTFVWNKKLEKEGLKNVSMETVEVLSRQKQHENKLELEKVKRRRLERELERQQREEEAVLQQRQREAAQFKEWEKQEEQFHLEQARLRSMIRIQDGRAKPIDLLAQYISNSKLEETLDMQMHEPYLILNGLEVQDLEDLLVDIKVYLELDKGNNSEFWNDMTVIVEDELHKIKKRQTEASDDNSPTAARRESIHQSVAKDVSQIFRGKSTTELDELRKRIEDKIRNRNEGVDISYWESLLSQLKAHMARARLRDCHQDNLKRKLEMLKVAGKEEISSETEGTEPHTFTNEEATSGSHADLEAHKEENEISVNPLDVCFDLYEKGGYSPAYISAQEIDGSEEVDKHVIDEHVDEQKISWLRAQVTKKIEQQSLTMSGEEMRMRNEARKGMASDEAEFSVETPITQTIQLASDRHRPRKPRYFNRVHTGFEWNKYNQTHYDMDNPPPKIVQGYKFNIFYPDLIDNSITPQYYLTSCEDNPDFAVLRFRSGPPYEDIAFKIVNREWEFSYKRGFRCQFHNNVFQLWFHFKRYRYRR